MMLPIISHWFTAFHFAFTRDFFIYIIDWHISLDSIRCLCSMPCLLTSCHRAKIKLSHFAKARHASLLSANLTWKPRPMPSEEFNTTILARLVSREESLFSFILRCASLLVSHRASLSVEVIYFHDISIGTPFYIYWRYIYYHSFSLDVIWAASYAAFHLMIYLLFIIYFRYYAHYSRTYHGPAFIVPVHAKMLLSWITVAPPRTGYSSSFYCFSSFDAISMRLI